jgi:hypothetical protein
VRVDASMSLDPPRSGVACLKFSAVGCALAIELLLTLGTISASAQPNASTGHLPPVVGRILKAEMPNVEQSVVKYVRTSALRVNGRGPRLRDAAVTFQIPQDVVNNYAGDWILAGDVRIALAGGSGYGEAVVSLSSNHRTWAQIEVFRKRTPGGAVIEWNTLDIIRGYVIKSEPSRSFVVPVVNFPSTKAVVPGRNTLRLHVQELGHLKVALASAPVVAYLKTSLSPNPVRITASVPRVGIVRAGDILRVPYLITNVNPSPQHDLKVAVRSSVGTRPLWRSRTINKLDSQYRGVVPVRVLREGKVSFVVVASNSVSGDAVRVTIFASPRSVSTGWTQTAAWGLGITLATFVGLSALSRLRRRS